ncbi:C2H2 type zinc finger [Pyrrhoderma noxium]|uniref:C2H2 type zinc finger n=1 Tax=Pyrrhoderma noxium TaxID=2282107 RepID=A0A286UL04_9AGAM|nr:C2H2 type zinc finger [Pyrrhoderma noxium]
MSSAPHLLLLSKRTIHSITEDRQWLPSTPRRRLQQAGPSRPVPSLIGFGPGYINLLGSEINYTPAGDAGPSSSASSSARSSTTQTGRRASSVPTPCNICGRILLSNNIPRHKRSVHHIGARIYVCQYDGCNFISTEEGNFRAHINGRHLNIKHQCPFEGCDMEFSDQSSLIRHKKEKHQQTSSRRRRAAAGVASTSLEPASVPAPAPAPAPPLPVTTTQRTTTRRRRPILTNAPQHLPPDRTRNPRPRKRVRFQEASAPSDNVPTRADPDQSHLSNGVPTNSTSAGTPTPYVFLSQPELAIELSDIVENPNEDTWASVRDAEDQVEVVEGQEQGQERVQEDVRQVIKEEERLLEKKWLEEILMKPALSFEDFQLIFQPEKWLEVFNQITFIDKNLWARFKQTFPRIGPFFPLQSLEFTIIFDDLDKLMRSSFPR